MFLEYTSELMSKNALRSTATVTSPSASCAAAARFAVPMSSPLPSATSVAAKEASFVSWVESQFSF